MVIFTAMEQLDKYQRIEKVLKIGIILLGIILVVMILTVKVDSCNLCSYEYKEKTLDVPGLLKIYSDKCFTPDLGFLNSSVGRDLS